MRPDEPATAPFARAASAPTTDVEDGVPRRPEYPPIRPGDSKMMLGFVVRECSVALGRDPTPAELAEWANHQPDERGGTCCLFGRAITAEEARVILKHRGRPVTVRPERLERGGRPASAPTVASPGPQGVGSVPGAGLGPGSGRDSGAGSGDDEV